MAVVYSNSLFTQWRDTGEMDVDKLVAPSVWGNLDQILRQMYTQAFADQFNMANLFQQQQAFAAQTAQAADRFQRDQQWQLNRQFMQGPPPPAAPPQGRYLVLPITERVPQPGHARWATEEDANFPPMAQTTYRYTTLTLDRVTGAVTRDDGEPVTLAQHQLMLDQDRADRAYREEQRQLQRDGNGILGRWVEGLF